jgi:hypothetical protein
VPARQSDGVSGGGVSQREITTVQQQYIQQQTLDINMIV